jgi:threonine/homoserine/homoserine lactone efflux protein
MTQALVYGAVALGAAQVRGGLRGSEQVQRLVARSVAVLLVGTAVWALWQGRQ